jgi:soluble cytochrome b562
MMKRTLTSLTLTLALATSAALAGPMADFETGFRTTYASYRMALFATNTGDADKSKHAIGEFDTRWRDLVSQSLSSPPPQYEDDPQWGTTLTEVTDAIATARQLSEEGKLPHAHEVLEHIRDAIGELHTRNGIVLFSDRMNAYHAKMEQVIETAADTEGSGQQLLEQAAVLAYLAEDMLKTPPAEASGNAEFDKLADGVKASVAELQAAARSGDAAAIKAAVSGVKMPYAKFFLKFG